MNKGTIILIVSAILILVLGGIIDTGVLKKQIGNGGELGVVQNIKNMQNLHLRSYYFEDMIEIDKNDNKDKVHAIVSVPVTLEVFIDLSKIRCIAGKNDSISKILLPHSEFKTPVFSVDPNQMKVIDIIPPFIQTGNGKEYESDCESVINKERQESDSLLIRAKTMNLISEADTDAVRYIKNFFAAINHRQIPIGFLQDTLNKATLN